MVNVFATWCTACVKEIPDLVEVQNEMKSKGVNIVELLQILLMITVKTRKQLKSQS